MIIEDGESGEGSRESKLKCVIKCDRNSSPLVQISTPTLKLQYYIIT